MERYSRVYKIGKYRFRYDRQGCMLEWIGKLAKWQIEDNEERTLEGKKPLWVTDKTGMIAYDSVGLSNDAWESDKKAWMEMWASQLDEETAELLASL